MTLLLAYVCMVCALSLYSPKPWLWTSAAPWGFVLEGWPRFGITRRDVWGNVMLYAPIGALSFALCFALCFGQVHRLLQRRLKQNHRFNQQLIRSTFTFFAVVCLGALLSLLLECLQTYVPTRVPSVVDWICNIFGTALGAIAVLMYTAWKRNALNTPMWLAHPWCIVWVGLWLLVMAVSPDQAFGFFPLVWDGGSLIAAETLSADSLVRLATVRAVLSLTAVIALLRLSMHSLTPWRTRILWCGALLLLAIIWRGLLWLALSLTAGYALDSGSVGDATQVLALTLLIAVVIAALPRLVATAYAVLSCSALWLSLYLYPLANPYIAHASLGIAAGNVSMGTLPTWVQHYGALAQIYHVLGLISAVWLPVAIGFSIHALWREKD